MVKNDTSPYGRTARAWARRVPGPPRNSGCSSGFRLAISASTLADRTIAAPPIALTSSARAGSSSSAARSSSSFRRRRFRARPRVPLRARSRRRSTTARSARTHSSWKARRSPSGSGSLSSAGLRKSRRSRHSASRSRISRRVLGDRTREPPRSVWRNGGLCQGRDG